MRLSACIEMLFAPEYAAFPDRIRASAAAGMDAVEFWNWRDKDLPGIEAALRDTGLTLSGFCAEPRGRLVDPATHADFLAGVRDSAALASRLGAPCLIVLSGDTLEGVERARQRAAIVAALRQAAPVAADAGVTLVLEPLNTVRDHAGYFLDSTVEGLDIVDEVDHPGLALLFDIYHSAMMAEDAATVLDRRGHRIGHVHAADTNGRHEPGTGTIAWAETIATLGRLGYAGPIGLEYRPTAGTDASLAGLRQRLEPA